MLTAGKLNAYLADIDEQANEMMERFVMQMAKAQGITEQLKADDILGKAQYASIYGNTYFEVKKSYTTLVITMFKTLLPMGNMRLVFVWFFSFGFKIEKEG